MKYLLFFLLLILFVWVTVVPPDGMSKFPAVNVKFDYSQKHGAASITLETEKPVTSDDQEVSE